MFKKGLVFLIVLSFLFPVFSSQAIAAIDTTNENESKFDPSCVLVIVKKSYILSELQAKTSFSSFAKTNFASVEEQIPVKNTAKATRLEDAEIEHQVLKLI